MSNYSRFALAFVAVGLAASTAQAQVNNMWATFVKDPNRIQNPGGSIATQITTDPDEKDYAWGDVNMDGWTDLVVVRKQPAATVGKRVGYLMMNENGILVDRTSQYAVDSDVAGDFGLSTPVNNRDVQLVDVDNDGWLDMVTATTLSDGDVKDISHPRVYHNKGSIGGVWQGFKYESARFPQLLTVGTNLPVAPRFCAVAVGDVTGDGYADLYFADYDTTETNITENPANDLNDRLLINDGNGYFTDSLQTRMTAAMLLSTFAMSAKIVDMNLDGVKDILKDTALDSLIRVSTAYNDPANVGFFQAGPGFETTTGDGQPYHIDVGDLNNDGRPDIVVSDDGIDYYRYNLSTDPTTHRVNWGVDKTFNRQGGSDDGFAGNNLIVDLNNDGWNDVIITDFDVDLPGCNRRCHIFHNPGGTPGAQITLVEEIQMTGSGGWKGVVGPTIIDLQGTYDIAVFDIDNDGDKDIVLGRCTGTTVWINQLFSPTPITAYCFGDGSGTLCPCSPSPVPNGATGNGCPNSGNANGARLATSGFASVSNDTLVLNGSGALPFGPGLFYQGSAAASAPFGNGVRCAGGATPRLEIQFTDGAGASATTVSVHTLGSDNAGDVRYYQLWYRDGAGFCTGQGFNLSNGVSLTWAP